MTMVSFITYGPLLAAKYLLSTGIESCPHTADYTHRKLVAYYRRLFGFKVVREVGGNGLRDLPDLLVWGGVGTRMNGDLESMLCKCSLTFQRPPRKARSLT